ncbi:hypothetical protein IPA_00430 [Ignicoccus pacificus DSM 13166]|uniref:DUF1641 domain-containing protein n=1 Tax=Ignicoccus pacificus DSM 13166 TaxID=940294 RepID=A0A977KAC1_9CREN|nr:hypothetical protein IPA_00430 [Ignicoccus pacificus DSM 13166]
MVEKKEIENIEDATKAMEELLEMLAKLKETGLLDMMKAIVERYEDLMTFLAQDRRLFHAMTLGEAMLNGMENVDAIRLKLSMQNLSECAFEALASEEVEKAEPVGLMGLMRALRDPDVMMGLGLLIAMAKALGKCVKKKRSQS